MLNILALETSTSASKVAIYSSKEGIKKVLSIPYDESISDTVTQDARGVLNSLVNAIKELLKSETCEIHAISLSGIWHSLLFLDQDRNPVSPIYTWADTRAAKTVAEFRRDEELWAWFYNKTGCAVHSLYPLWKIVHLKRSAGFIQEGTLYHIPVTVRI